MAGISELIKTSTAGFRAASPLTFFTGSATLASDIGAGLRNWRAWIFKGWYDIVLRYRRTAIGPFWLVLTTGTMIGCLAIVAPSLFGGSNPSFNHYLVAGILSWTYLSVCITEMSGAFIENAANIRSIRLPSSLYIFQVLFRNTIVYAHLLLIYAFVILTAQGTVEPNILLFLAHVIFVLIVFVPFGFVLAILCARYRDIQQLVGAVMQIAFLLTPVFWDKGMLLESRRWVIEYNPLFHLLEMLRAPLLGQSVPPSTYMFVTMLFIGGLVSSGVLYRAFIRRIPFWL
jgi:ABC-type polysaccharide/polyol phosphate export permease